MNQNQNSLPSNETPAHLFNQVDQQIANGQPPTVLIERSNGDIQPAQLQQGMRENSSPAFWSDSGKMIPNEKLTDKYQEHLAGKLAGVALRGSVMEVPITQSAAPEKPSAEALNKARTEADNKYQSIRNFGGTHEEAEAAADRVWKRHGF